MPAEAPILIWMIVFLGIVIVFLRQILLPLKVTVNAREAVSEVKKEEDEKEVEDEEEEEAAEKEDEEEEEEGK